MKTEHTSDKTKIDIADMCYVEAVLCGKIASCVADGDLEPPQGARCKTRSGFWAWLKRARIAKAEGR